MNTKKLWEEFNSKVYDHFKGKIVKFIDCECDQSGDHKTYTGFVKNVSVGSNSYSGYEQLILVTFDDGETINVSTSTKYEFL